MIFNSEIELDVKSAKERFQWLVDNKKTFELIEKREKRSIKQNSYLHLLFSWFALQTGYTESEVKQEIFKAHVNTDIFYEGETGKIIKVHRWRSTADLNSKEMSLSIDRFRDFSAKDLGIYLPTPEDMVSINQMERELSKYSSMQYVK